MSPIKRRIFIISIATMFFVLSFCPAVSADGAQSYTKNLNIATVDNRPLSIDRLVYTALTDFGYEATHITAASLQAGYELANDGERDGVISSLPDMEQTYPDVRKVPVLLDHNIVQAFVRNDSELEINEWSDLSGLNTGLLTGRVYLLHQSAAYSKSITVKETTRLLMEGLISGEYDVVILAQRLHETLTLPNGVKGAGQVEILEEYLYLNKKHENLVPDISKALNNVFADGRGDKILDNIPIPEISAKKTVVHIYSTNSELANEEQISEKLRAYTNDDEIEWYTIGLNTKRFSFDSARLVNFSYILRQDCISRNVAAIVVSGDDALEFLKNYYNLFFINIPVLFYGVGDNYETLIQGYEPYFTGIVERLSAFDTVSVALGLFPETAKLYVLNDYTTEGKHFRSVAERQLEPFASIIDIEYNGDKSRDSVLAEIKDLPKDSIVLIGSYFRDANGQYFSQSEMRRVLELNCKVPLFGIYSTGLVYGSIGGKMLDYEKYGDVMAEMLTRVLDTESAFETPIIADSEKYNRWVFDKHLMDKWGIRARLLPKGTEIINKRLSVWEANPVFTLGMVALLAISIIAVIITQIYMRRDRTMQRKLRQAVLAAEDASRAKSAFLANMSHEIRTPMNGVIGFSELALGRDVSVEDKNEYLRKIKSSGEALLRIINDVLDISKIEAGKLSLESIPFDIHEVLKLCRMLILPKAEEKGIELHYYAEHSEGKRLIGDPTRLQQALLNLLSNAVKFTDSGMVTLRSDILKDTGDSLTVSFEVKDSGIGMSEEQIKRIFDPFMQADDSTTRRYGGTGLGLSITKNIVELMGGKLKVESAPGAGSKFCFELKFETADQPNAAQEGENDRDGAERPIFEGDILVCEDNEINRQVICGHLARVGITVVTAANGREAVDIVRKRTESGEKPFDIILMDIHMPIMDGVEAAELIVVSGCKTPIVAMTADVMAEKKKYYRLHNMPDHIAKPFTAKDLWTCLLKYLTPASTETYGADKPEAMAHVLAVDKEKAAGLFDRLAMLLESDSVESLELTDELRTLPGTGTLIRQIENYDYEPALQTLAAVRRSLGVDA